MAGLGTEAPGFTADRKRDIMWGFYFLYTRKLQKKEKKVKFHYQRFRKMKRKEEEETEELCVKASI